MVISELIEMLRLMQEDHGDLPVETYHDRRMQLRPPELAYRRILHGRESRPEFWSSYHGEDCRGEPVCRI